MYSTRLFLPKVAFLMPLRWTFMMTEPSFRCRFTFLPMKLFALFKLKLSIFGSPFLFLVSYVGPALFADGSFLAVEHDVEFDVFASTGGFPGIFTMFHFFVSVCS